MPSLHVRRLAATEDADNVEPLVEDLFGRPPERFRGYEELLSIAHHRDGRLLRIERAQKRELQRKNRRLPACHGRRARASCATAKATAARQLRRGRLQPTLRPRRARQERHCDS